MLLRPTLGPRPGVHSFAGVRHGSWPRCMSRVSTGSEGGEAPEPEGAAGARGRQEAQGCLGNIELSSWAALDTGNEAKTKCV